MNKLNEVCIFHKVKERKKVCLSYLQSKTLSTIFFLKDLEKKKKKGLKTLKTWKEIQNKSRKMLIFKAVRTGNWDKGFLFRFCLSRKHFFKGQLVGDKTQQLHPGWLYSPLPQHGNFADRFRSMALLWLRGKCMSCGISHIQKQNGSLIFALC